jgi:hypothetical protein
MLAIFKTLIIFTLNPAYMLEFTRAGNLINPKSALMWSTQIDA